MSDETLSADGLLNLAKDFDAGVDIDSQPQERPETKTEAPTEQAEPSAEPAGKEESNSGEAKQEVDTKPKEKKSESKFAQENARKTKTWEQINAEKEAIKAEKEALRREREEWGKHREQSKVAETNSYRDEKGYTAEDYEAAAKEFEADGDSQLAKAARAKAEGVRKIAGEQAQKVQTEKFQKQWADTYGRLSEKESWLKDQNSAEYKRTVQLLQQFPLLTTVPDGLVHAVEIVKLQDSAAKSQALQDEVKTLRDQLGKLQQKTAIGKGVATGPLKAEEKDFSKLSLKEQRDALMRASREFDSGRE